MPNHSVLIVGAGVSGMRAALAAKERGSDVALITKVHPLRTHGGTSQGGSTRPCVTGTAPSFTRRIRSRAVITWLTRIPSNS